MLARIRPRLNHATVVAYLALLVALGGTSLAASQIGSSQIANDSVRSRDLRNNDVRGEDIRRGAVKGSDVGNSSLTGADINESSLATVPTATAAGTAGVAGNAVTLNGIGASGFLRSSPPEAYHEVDTPGEPQFGTGWSNLASISNTTAAFFKDPFGIVHLKGAVSSTQSSQNTIFTLPAGYRPTKSVCVPTGSTAAALSCIGSNGLVYEFPTDAADTYYLDGITFRAGAG